MSPVIITGIMPSVLTRSMASAAWACLPRFDSPSVFTRLLDPAAGYWALTPAVEPLRGGRAYVEDTMVVHTEHVTEVGLRGI
ncbi:hypothetical protein BH23ACT12_BH23ACT12_10170 [soil metagenome]